MPVFYFLVILFAVFLWFILSFVYKPVGRFFYRLWHDAKEIMDETENAEEQDEN